MVAVQNRQLQDRLVRSWVFEELAPTAYDVMTLWRYGAVQCLPNAVPVEGLQREPLLWLWGLETGMIFWICTSMYQQTAFFKTTSPYDAHVSHASQHVFFPTCSLLPGSPWHTSGQVTKPPTNRCCTAARSALKRRKRLAKEETLNFTIQSITKSDINWFKT